MTQPIQQQTVNANKGWHFLTHRLARDTPFQLTHGAHALRAILAMTGKR